MLAWGNALGQVSKDKAGKLTAPLHLPPRRCRLDECAMKRSRSETGSPVTPPLLSSSLLSSRV